MGAMLNNESIVNTIEKSIPSFVGLVPTKRIIIAKYAEPEDFVSASIYAEENKFLFIFKNSNIVAQGEFSVDCPRTTNQIS